MEGAFRQSWESIATAAMQPQSATLGLGPSDDRSRTMRLSYAGRSVTGTATASRDPHSLTVSAELPEDIVDQRVDWAALMSAPLSPGDALAFAVFDPWSGTSAVTARVGEPEPVTVPAGIFTVLHVTYRIDKRDRGLEQYDLWVTEKVPRLFVREDFPGGARSELVEVAE